MVIKDDSTGQQKKSVRTGRAGMRIKKAITRIIDLYRQYGGQQYGEEITQLEHALQAAELAIADGRDDEVIAAAFLHDIGHLLESDGVASMGDYGVVAHDKLGADYVISLGFSDRIAQMIGCHVQAKRYLCAIEPGYYDQLSKASQETLHWQGGVMTMEEVSDFSSRNDLEEILALRRYDEQAKEQEKATEGLPGIEPVLFRVLEQQVAVA